jgi:hypothetical protein
LIEDSAAKKLCNSSQGDSMSKPYEKPTETMARKPYEKPTVRYERVFETMALSCGKVQGTGGSCSFNRKNS